MCGILGQINFYKKSDWNVSLFNKALDLQIHRGPDNGGIKTDNDFIFGHRRLSIIDIDSRANQPMVSHDGMVFLVFNGEIYNYKELKSSLVKKGYKFQTTSDSEVLLYSYYEEGIDCINSLIGMFAFGIYDKRNNKSYIVRDRLGIKPLYYFKKNKNLIFSSEIKSILKLAKIERKLNLTAVSSYLSFRYPILNDTFFEEINSLEPGHYIEFTKNSFNTRKYWSLSDKFKEQKNDKGEDFYINEIKKLLTSSVNYRMLSDVPIGAFLSGGLDSSIIAALMSNSSDNQIMTFISGFSEKGFNEFEFAEIVAKKYETNHTELIVDSTDYLNNMIELIGFKDSPLSVPNEVALFIMSKMLKKYITVVLSGEGADEIFGGYGRIFLSPYDLERIKNIEKLNLSKSEKITLKNNFNIKYKNDFFENELDHFLNIYSYTNYEEKVELLNQDIPLKKIEKLFFDKFNCLFEELGEESYTNKMMYAFEKIHLQGLLLRLDNASMAASVEARVPFVDHRLVEFAFTIPTKYKIRWSSKKNKKISKLLMSDQISEVFDVPKSILKKSFKDLIPEKIIDRKKVGFPVPLQNWFGDDFNSYAKEVLLSDKAKKRGLYNTSNLNKFLNEDRLNHDHSFALKIWMLVNLELFNIKYID